MFQLSTLTRRSGPGVPLPLKVSTAWSRTEPAKILRNRIAGHPGPAKATASRQHSQVLSTATVVSPKRLPSSDQAKASAAPAYFLVATLRLSSQAANTLPEGSMATVSKRWLVVSAVKGCGAAKLAPL